MKSEEPPATILITSIDVLNAPLRLSIQAIHIGGTILPLSLMEVPINSGLAISVSLQRLTDSQPGLPITLIATCDSADEASVLTSLDLVGDVVVLRSL